MNNKLKLRAFTLAEILITLGIIGVIAAMTIPTLVTKYQIKVLQAGFNRMDKQIRDALVELQFENNTDDFFKMASNAGLAQNTRYSEMFYKKFNITDILSNKYFQNMECPKGYSGKEQECLVNGFYLKPRQILKDGATIYFLINSWKSYICFDTNGPYKGPNRLGYDTFIIITRTARNLGEEYNDPEYCSVNSDSTQNGWSCYYYAKNDINPDDTTQRYWENLKF